MSEIQFNVRCGQNVRNCSIKIECDWILLDHDMDASHVSFEITLIGEMLVAESTMVGGGALVGQEVLHH